jgi:EAL domain-containing protein (putative c-di-GMP-specific phosphodiesterase class I)/PleD family two-component response regulator
MMNNDIWSGSLHPGLDEAGTSPMRSPLLDAKVMMVDDEPLMTELIQTHLEDEGYTNFVVTNDPRQALELLKREKPGVLLLDLMMPQVSGFDLLAAMRADSELRYTPVIVLTASTGADSKLRALRLGATDFLGKPVDASELVLRVRNTLAFQQYRERQVNFDQVTGLPNERLFERAIDMLLARPEQRNGLLALFSITVPECQQLRESVDRPTANALAAVVARRLERLSGLGADAAAGLRAPDASPRVARLGEQMFGLVVDDLRDTNAVVTCAKRVLAALSEPVLLDRHEVVPVPWLGVAVAPGDGDSASTLRQSADLAATHGRRQATAQITFASPELNAQSYHRLMLGSQLRGAAQRDELRLHYQPKVDVANGHIVGVEALVRWQHPEHGLMPPGRFIPLSEELGLTSIIGEWVLEQACREVAGWARSGLREISVAVNVSKLQVVAGDLGQVVRRALFDSGLPARQLVIELTESMLMDDVPHCLGLMNDLKSIGVTLAIDDFGTGYSSLSYLKKFPLDELKIDRSFIADLPGRTTDTALVRTVIELGHSLGMTVTAEGVETDAQLACVTQLGCDTFQGFLFERPVPPQRCLELISSQAAIAC